LITVNNLPGRKLEGRQMKIREGGTRMDLKGVRKGLGGTGKGVKTQAFGEKQW